MNFNEMTNDEIYEYFRNITEDRSRKITDSFNERDGSAFGVERRIEYINYLEKLPSTSRSKRTPCKTALDDLLSLLRSQAVLDFWDAERSLILQGKGTRDWSQEDQVVILNLDASGNMRKHAGIPKKYKINYMGHHMCGVKQYPQFAGDCRNIQALLINTFWANRA